MKTKYSISIEMVAGACDDIALHMHSVATALMQGDKYIVTERNGEKVMELKWTATPNSPLKKSFS